MCHKTSFLNSMNTFMFLLLVVCVNTDIVFVPKGLDWLTVILTNHTLFVMQNDNALSLEFILRCTSTSTESMGLFASLPSLCWKHTLTRSIRIKGMPFCNQLTTALSSEMAGAGVEGSSPPSSLLLWRSVAEDEAEWSREVRLCDAWWKWWWWWWWWCWPWRGRNGWLSVRWDPSSLDDAVIWMNTSGGEPKTSPAAWKGADVTAPDDTPTKPEKSCWGVVGESGLRQSNTPPSSRLLSEPSVWLLFLSQTSTLCYTMLNWLGKWSRSVSIIWLWMENNYLMVCFLWSEVE